VIASAARAKRDSEPPRPFENCGLAHVGAFSRAPSSLRRRLVTCQADLGFVKPLSSPLNKALRSPVQLSA